LTIYLQQHYRNRSCIAATHFTHMKTLFQKATRIALCLSVIASSFIHALNGSTEIAFAAPVPAATITPAATTAQLGNNVQFNVSFDNVAITPPLVGYGPYLDVLLPLGIDGGVAAPLDGLSFNSATYLGQPVTPIDNFFCGPSGSFVHPLTGLITTCTPRQQVVVLPLPFGSFTDGQPPASVQVNTTLSNLADVGVPISLTVQPGFQFGASPTGTVPITGSLLSAQVTPSIFDLAKTYNGPEDETATGPNFPRSYNVQTSIAPGIPLTNLVVTDNLPNTIAFITGTITTAPTAVISNTPANGIAASPNPLRVRHPSVTGSASLGFQFFVPLTDSTGSPVLGVTTGAPRQSANDVLGVATWAPIDPRDVGGVITSNVTISDHILTQRSIATQKGVSVISGGGPNGEPRPGAVVQYTLNVQVSDFFSFNGVVLSDTMPDGLRFDTTFTPTLSGNFNPFTLTAASMAGANFNVKPNYTPASSPPNDGTTGLVFSVSNELQSRGRPNGNVLGGCINPAGGTTTPNCATYNDGATTFVVTYRAVVQDNFSDNPGNVPLDILNALNNTAIVAGNVLSNSTFAQTGSVAQDTSGQTITTASFTIEKTVYALEGTVCSPQPCANVPVTNSARVTFRLRTTVPSGDFRGVRLDDYLPLPVFEATDVITFTPSLTTAAPAIGVAAYGPSHTLSLSNVLTMTTEITPNVVSFIVGPANDALNQPRVIDILFTVPAADRPFVDGLLFTNLVQTSIQNAQGVTTTQQSIVQMNLLQPALLVRKGVVATDNPAGVFSPPVVPAFSTPPASCPRFTGVISSTGLAANPINSNLRNVDGGDRVTYAIVVENIGSSPFGAFDINISDTLPAQATFAPGSLCVTNGAGTTLASTGSITGGLLLTDPSIVQGALTRGRLQGSNVFTTSGRNIAVVTYDVILNSGNVAPQATVSSTLVNTATLNGYAAINDGFNFLSGRPLSDTANTNIAPPAFGKLFIGTEISNTFNTASQVSIGELITYSLVITVPEGRTPNLSVIDTLDAGLAFAELFTITASSNVTRAGGFAAVVTPTVTNSGRTGTWVLGDIFNGNSNNAVTDVITLTYTALALNTAANGLNQLRNNSAQATYAATGTLPAVSAPDVTIIEPALALLKQSNANRPDAGDTVIFTLTVTNTAAAGIAYDTVLTDLVPAGMTYVAGSLRNVSGPAAAFIEAAPLLTATWSSVPISPAATSVITFAATLDLSVNPSQTLTNAARIAWTSLPGFAQPATRSPYNTASTERDGSGGINTYSTTAQVAFGTRQPGFAKSFVTSEIIDSSNSITQVTIGELVTYTIVLTVPEGTSTNVVITDSLPTNSGNIRMAFVACNSISAAAALSTGAAGGFAGVCSAPSVLESGRVAVYNFGTITNTDTNNAVAETLRFTYTTVVLNVTNNSSTATSLRNTAQLVQTNFTQSNQSTLLPIIEPSIGISKSVSPLLGDFGDPITYTIVLTGASGATAYGVVITDALPESQFTNGTLINLPLLNVADSAGVVSDTNFSIIGNNITGFTLTTILPFDLPISPTRRITLTIRGTLSGLVAPEIFITNTARSQWTSLPGDVNAPRSSFNTNSVERIYPPISATVVSRVFDLDPVKTIVATSEGSTITGTDNIQRVTIGEIVTYRLRMRLLEFRNPNVQFLFTDRLPAGMSYITGTARVGFISQNGLITSTAVTTATPGCAGLNQNLGDPLLEPANVLTCTLPASQVIASGNVITFDLGFMTNREENAATEYIVIDFNAQALNVAGNVSGAVLTNVLTVTVPGIASASSPTNTLSGTVIIAEPRLTARKLSTPQTGLDAGDLVTFTLIVTNTTGANATTAFDTVLTDVVDGRLALQTPITIQAPGYAVVTNTTAGNIITVSVNEIRAGDRMTVTAVSRVVSTTAVGSAIPNVANTRFTSLPGLSGTVPNSTTSVITGTPGSAFGERDGSGGINNYTAAASTSMTLTTPLFSKGRLWPGPGQPQLTIGDPITFSLLITLPEGTTQNVSVLDTLPAGLALVSTQVVTQAAQSAGLLGNDFAGTVPSPTLTQPGGNVLFAFGNITTTDDNNAGNNTFLIFISTRIANLNSNQNGVVLTNTASLTYTHPVSGVTNLNGGNVTVRVIEPRLTAQKSVTPTVAQAGDTLTYTVRFSNTGESTAFDVTMTDTLPSGVAQPALVSCAINSVEISSTLSGTPPSIAISPTVAGAWDVPVNQALVCSYTVVAQTNLSIHSAFTNTADADWTSRDGDDPNQRVYDDGNPAILFDGTQDTATSTFTSPPAQMGKSDGGTITATLGSVIRYTLTFTSPLGTVRNLIITDALPTGMGYIAGSAAITGPITPQPAPSLVGSALVWNFGDAVVTPTRVVTLTFNAVVSDVVANASGQVRTNVVTATYRNSEGVLRPALVASDTFTVVEPNLIISKLAQLQRAPSGAGDTVTYTVRVTNTGTSPAFDVVITDVLPAGLAFIATQGFTVTNSATLTDANIAGSTALSYGVSQINVNAVATITFTARITDAIAASTRLTNTAQGFYSSLEGGVANERPYTTTVATAAITTGLPALPITKIVTPTGLVAPGDLLTYTIVTTNTGIVTATGVVVTDAVPAGTTFVSASTPFAGPPPVQWTIGNLDIGASRTFTMVVQATSIISGTPLVNTARVSSNEGVSNTATVTNPLGLADVAVEKDVDPVTPIAAGDTLTWTITYRNLGNVPAQNVVITDVVPNTMNWDGSFVATPPLSSPVQGTWVLSAPLAPGASGTIVFTTTSQITSSLSALLTNTVSITTTSVEVTTANNTDIAVSPSIRVELSKDVFRSPVNIGEQVSYTLRLTNTGGFTLTAIPLTDTFDSTYLQFVTASPFPTSVSGDQLAWSSVGTPLLAGQSTSVVVTFLAISTTNGLSTTNTATATAASGSTVTRRPVTDTADVQITSPALVIHKRSANSNGDPLRPGERITYTIVVTNTGDGTASNVTVSDALPAFTTFVAGSTAISGASGTAGAPPALATGITLPPAGVVTVTFAVTAAIPLTNGLTITNTAGVSSTQTPDPVTGTVTDVVSSTHAISISKSVAPAIVGPGGLLTYTIFYTVTGDEPANSVTISDRTPLSTTFSSASDSPVLAPSIGGTGDVVWALGTLLPATSGITQSTGTRRMTVRVDGVVLSGTQIINSALITDASGLTDTAQATATVNSAHDLALIKRVQPAIAAPGDLITYTITYSVTGNEPSLGTTISDVLPAEIAFVSSEPPPTFTDGNTQVWSLGDQSPTKTATLTITARITDTPLLSGTLLVNRAGITDTQGLTRTDPATVTINSARDLQLSKRAGQTTIDPGGLITYSIVFTKTGNAPALDVTLQDALPANTTYITSTPVATQSGQTLLWSFGTLVQTTTQFITVTVQANEPLPNGTPLVNTATLTDAGGITVTDQATTTVISSHTLALSKSASPLFLAPGEQVTYTLLYTVTGNEPAFGVTLTDTLPAGVSFVSSDPAPASLSGQTQTWAFGTLSPTLAAPVTGTVMVTAQLNSAPVLNGTTFTNTARLTDTGGLSDTASAIITAVTSHTLSITKTALVAEAIAGTPLSYNIEWAVNGNEPSLNTTVRDTLPPGTTFASCTGGCPPSGSTLTWSLGDQTPPTGGTFNVVVNVAANVPTGTVLLNTATITDAQGITATDEVTVPVVSQADVIVDKGASPSPVFAGEALTYSIVVSNAGPSDAQNVVLTDVLPVELTLTSCSASGATCIVAGNSLTVAWTTLALNEQQRITVTVQVSSEVLAGANITNTAWVTSGTPDPNAGNNVDDAITPVVARADLGIVKTAEPATVVAGETLTYTLVVSNAGPSAARPVTVTDVLPSEVSFVSCSRDGTCDIAGNAVTITFPSLSVGQSQLITIVATVSAGVPSGTIITNTAVVTSSTPDPNPINNTDDVTTPVTTRADLGILKDVTPVPVLAGETLTYTLVVSNAGPSVAQGVTVSDALPAQVTFASCSSNGACVNAGNAFTVTFPSLSVGQTEIITVVATANANVLSGTLIANTAAVTGTTPDDNPINNTDDATTTVEALADLGILKDVTPVPVIAGETLTYTLVYSNAGPSDAQGARITDTLPAGVTFGGVASASPALPAPTVNGSTVVFDLGTLAASASGNIVFTATVTGNAASVITNTAQIGSITPDPNAGNNIDDAGTNVWFADVAIVKSVEPTRPVIAGETMTYTLVFSNVGNAPAQNVVVSDVVPAGLAWNGGYSASLPASLTAAPPQLTWALGTLPAGASGSIVFTVTVNGNDDTRVSYVNTAGIGTTTPQTDTTNDGDQTTSNRLLLDVTKTASSSTVVVGQQVSYTLRVSNIGAAAVLSVPLTDTYDAAFLQFVSASIAPSATAPGLLAWENIGPINAGATVDIIATFTALTTTFGLSTTNTVTATGSIPEVTLPPITDTATVQVLAPALGVVKSSQSEGDPTVRPGERLTYTIVITNSGDATATGVGVSDTLPAFTTFVAGSVTVDPAGGTTGTPPILASGLVVPAGGAVTVTYAVTVAIPLTDGVEIINTVAVSSTEVPTQVTSTVTDVVASSHVLSLTKSASPQVIAPGDRVTFTLQYTVTGDEPVIGLRLNDALPPEMSVVATLPPASNVTGNDVTWNLGNVLTATEGITQMSGSVLLVAQAQTPLPNGLVVTNSATLFDQSETNIDAIAPVTIEATHTLQILKRAEPATVLAGSRITYTLLYTIAGNEPVFNVIVRDTTPANTTFVAGDPLPTSAPAPGGTGEVQWALGNVLLASSGITRVTGVVTMVVQANVTLPADLTTITNTASIQDDSGKRDESTVTQGVPADVAIVKTVTPALVLVSDLVTYTLVVSNNGPGLAQNVIVTDALPAGLTLVSAGGNPISTNPLIWPLGDLLAGQVVTLQVVARAPATTNTTLVNIAQAGTSSPETRTDNNSSQVPVTTGQPALVIAKSVSAGSGAIIRPEQVLTYTIVVTNTGTLPATNVVLTDTAPERTAYVQGSATPPAAVNGATLVWQAGTLQVGQAFTASFAVRVAAQVTTQQSIRNVALVSSLELTGTDSNEVINILPPTAIQLASFTAKRNADGTVSIEWVTQSEINTFAFNVLRADDITGTNKVYVNDPNDPIRASGGNVLTSYAITDTAAPAERVYYWLEETENDNTVLLYGPFALTMTQPQQPEPAMFKVFVPVAIRE
jgi:uncharacterized repeat protein (TIGR01451 family)/fimbrial isopeptide formation D2 family protein